jgi:hypothetical protein
LEDLGGIADRPCCPSTKAGAIEDSQS